MTSTSDRTDDDVIVVTQDHLVDGPAASTSAGPDPDPELDEDETDEDRADLAPLPDPELDDEDDEDEDEDGAVLASHPDLDAEDAEENDAESAGSERLATGVRPFGADLSHQPPDPAPVVGGEPGFASAVQPATNFPGPDQPGQHRRPDDDLDTEQDSTDQDSTDLDTDLDSTDLDSADLDTDLDSADQASADQHELVQEAEDSWPEIQSLFVDDPRTAVERAAQVTTGALTALTAAVRNSEQSLRDTWQGDQVGSKAGTEELRIALQGYRELANRLAVMARDL